jgi:hypothetical protein
MSGRAAAVDSYDVIRWRMLEIRQQAEPTCAVAGRPYKVRDCLRNPVPCPDNCPLKGDWLGPETA